jgi:hypothetical protein
MAVIRSSRLFTARLPVNMAAKPSIPGVPDDRDAATTLGQITCFTCPPGHKAILRNLTTVMFGIPTAGSEPVCYTGLTPVSGTAVDIHWFWFVEHTANMAAWRLSESWQCNVVLNAGDQLSMRLVAPIEASAHGSGHIIPL